MKKMLSFLLAVLMMLGAMPAMAEDTIRNPLPDEIAALFDVPAWEGFEVAQCDDTSNWLSWVYSEDMDAGVVIMTNGSLHIVCLIEPDKDGNLRITQRNYKMVVGNAMPRVDASWGNAYEQITPPWGEKRVFELINNNGYHISIGKFDGVWRVKIVWDYMENSIALVNDEKIGYIQGVEREDYVDYSMNNVKYAYGTYDNRFAAFNMYDFPKSLEEARAKLTNPPVTPTDFYTPVTVNLRVNEKYDVFAAPGRSSYRAANGKAEMSTNDWVQIFGEENGWLLVQYDISSDQMRFGYIDASALPRGTQVQRLSWYDLPEQTIISGAIVTDDPLVSNNVIHTLAPGETVKVLSDFGSWYYIETQDSYGRTLRGFIPQRCIEIVTEDDLVG